MAMMDFIEESFLWYALRRTGGSACFSIVSSFIPTWHECQGSKLLLDLRWHLLRIIVSEDVCYICKAALHCRSDEMTDRTHLERTPSPCQRPAATLKCAALADRMRTDAAARVLMEKDLSYSTGVERFTSSVLAVHLMTRAEEQATSELT